MYNDGDKYPPVASNAADANKTEPVNPVLVISNVIVVVPVGAPDPEKLNKFELGTTDSVFLTTVSVPPENVISFSKVTGT